MGYDINRRTNVFETVPRRFHDTSSNEEVLPYVIFIDCTATDALTSTYQLNDDVRVIDAVAIATAANVDATVTVQDNDGNAITDAMVIATDKATARAGSIDDVNWEESEGNNLKVVQNANGDSCYVYITVIPTK